VPGGAEWSSVPGASPIASLTRPTKIIVENVTMKKYVGSPKMAPDSRIPRKLPQVMTKIASSASGTRRV
jgi:hypothetical protein